VKRGREPTEAGAIGAAARHAPAPERRFTLPSRRRGGGRREAAALPAAAIYARYAALFLVVTLLTGIWLRAAFLRPQVLGGFTFGHALHAHSHVAFFGWTSMALFAALCRRIPEALLRPGLRVHAHAVAIASGAAFASFLAGGYNAVSIAVSVAHVGLWFAFAALAWAPIRSLRGEDARFHRGALAFLLLAGAGAMAPGYVMVRGIEDPWIGQLAVHSFLTPFLGGWLLLGVMGTVYAALPSPRWASACFRWTAAGVLPSVFLHPLASPPVEWLLVVGRAGTVAMGVGAMLFALDVLRSSASAPLLRLAGGAAAIKGVGEIAVGAGLGLELIAIRPLTIAYLHLILLGVVTPVLIAAALRSRAAAGTTLLYAAGLTLMLASLALAAWPATAVRMATSSFSPLWLHWAPLLGGIVSTAAVLTMLAAGRRRPPSRGSAAT
jgi:hypothetical protein